MSTPKVSVIIPVYNVEKYIERCVNSILNQTFQDYEVLLIDDGSTDNSGKICDEYSLKDSRIKVFHKENGGVSSARNLGIDSANGEWIYFCDSDDELTVEGLKILVNQIEDSVDMVCGKYDVIDTQLKEKKKFETDLKTLSSKSYAQLLLTSYNGEYQGYLWCKLFKTDIIWKNKLSFDCSLYYNEDRLFILQYLFHMAGKVRYVPQTVYRYNERCSSAMGKIETKVGYKRFRTDLVAFCKMRELVVLWDDSIIYKHIRNALYNSWRFNMGLVKRYSNNPLIEYKELILILIQTIGLLPFMLLTTKKLIYRLVRFS